jgi:aminoglycoside/choline kinase family phosphotransferase
MRLFKQSAQDKLRKAKKIITSNFEGLADDAHVEPMHGGASDREYYRVLMPRVPINNSGVLMLMDSSFRLESSDYYQISELMRKLNLPVPAIYQEFSSQGALYLQDIGEIHLNDLVKVSPDDTVMIESLYKQAIDHLITLQTRAANYSDGVAAFGRALIRANSAGR